MPAVDTDVEQNLSDTFGDGIGQYLALQPAQKVNNNFGETLGKRTLAESASKVVNLKAEPSLKQNKEDENFGERVKLKVNI